MKRNCALVAGIVVMILSAPARGEPVIVFAAASLKGALDEAVAGYAGEVVVSYGGSGGMARQVEQGAPANVVILAHADWMDWLEDQGVIEQGSRRNLWGNRLVLIGPDGAAPVEVTAPSLLAALDGGRMAVGQLSSVPAGIYAKEWMQAAGLWEALSTHLAETENVRAALTFVARGEAPLGVVYASDARAAKVTVLHEVSPELHTPITYPAAVVHTNASAQAHEFLSFLKDDPQGIFARHGFVTGPAQ